MTQGGTLHHCGGSILSHPSCPTCQFPQLSGPAHEHPSPGCLQMDKNGLWRRLGGRNGSRVLGGDGADLFSLLASQLLTNSSSLRGFLWPSVNRGNSLFSARAPAAARITAANARTGCNCCLSLGSQRFVVLACSRISVPSCCLVGRLGRC